VQGTERADEPTLVVGGDALTTHQEEVMPAEEVAELGLLVGAAWPGDVEVHQLDAERFRHGRDAHHRTPTTRTGVYGDAIRRLDPG
jgi:hypothetical protein